MTAPLDLVIIAVNHFSFHGPLPVPFFAKASHRTTSQTTDQPSVSGPLTASSGATDPAIHPEGPSLTKTIAPRIKQGNNGDHTSKKTTYTAANTNGKAKAKAKSPTATKKKKPPKKAKKVYEEQQENEDKDTWPVKDILGIRKAKDWQANKPSFQLLVKWENFEQDDPTWYHVNTLSAPETILDLLLPKLAGSGLGIGEQSDGRLATPIPGFIVGDAQPEGQAEGASEAMKAVSPCS